MKDTNEIVIIGRLTRDPELAYTNGGTACLKFAIAVNESRKKSDGTWGDYANFFDVVVWGKTAENIKPYLNKGKQVSVSGSLHQDRWEKDGRTNSRVNINAEDVQLLGGKSESSSAPKVDADGFPEDVPF